MAIDPNRAAFVLKPFRYNVAEDMSVKTLYPNAEEYVVDSNLDATESFTLCSGLLAALKVPARVFQVTIAKALSADDFTSGLPRYTATFPTFNLSGVIVKVISCEIDYLNDRTTMVVRS